MLYHTVFEGSAATDATAGCAGHITNHIMGMLQRLDISMLDLSQIAIAVFTCACAACNARCAPLCIVRTSLLASEGFQKQLERHGTIPREPQ